jgi:hypothetical protein
MMYQDESGRCREVTFVIGQTWILNLRVDAAAAASCASCNVIRPPVALMPVVPLPRCFDFYYEQTGTSIQNETIKGDGRSLLDFSNVEMGRHSWWNRSIAGLTRSKLLASTDRWFIDDVDFGPKNEQPVQRRSGQTISGHEALAKR